MILKDEECEDVDVIKLARDMAQWRASMNMVRPADRLSASQEGFCSWSCFSYS
jgi:hypothetical protein